MGRCSDKEFLYEAMRLIDAKDINTARKWWGAFSEVIKRQLYFSQKAELPGLGKFKCRQVDEAIQHQRDPKTGKMIEYYQPARVVPVWINADDFINDVNGRAVTKMARRRAKDNIITQRDYQRMARQELLDAMEKEDIPQKTKEEMKNNFMDFLAKKKEKVRKKEEKENELSKQGEDSDTES